VPLNLVDIVLLIILYQSEQSIVISKTTNCLRAPSPHPFGGIPTYRSIENGTDRDFRLLGPALIAATVPTKQREIARTDHLVLMIVQPERPCGRETTKQYQPSCTSPSSSTQRFFLSSETAQSEIPAKFRSRELVAGSNSSEPHWHPCGRPIGRTEPSEAICAANTEPHDVQVATIVATASHCTPDRTTVARFERARFGANGVSENRGNANGERSEP